MGIGACVTPTITELFVTGNLEFDQVKESRVKEWVVTCDSGESIFPANLIVDNSDGCGIGGWCIGDEWTGEEGSLSGPHPDSPLLVQQVRARQLTRTAIRITALYSTDMDFWVVSRKVQVVTQSAPLLVDLNARDNPLCAGSPDPPPPFPYPLLDFNGDVMCKDYCGVVADFPQASKEHLARIDFDRGRDIPVAKYSASFSGHFAMTRADVDEIGRLTNSLNASNFIFGNDDQEWRFSNMVGNEVRFIKGSPTSIWQLEMNFEHDQHHHLILTNVGAEGGITQFGGTLDGKLVCKAARGFEVFDWSLLSNLLIP